ncbi:Arc family DNA-binding protein [Neisseriaceae bacterium CLB008]
MEKDTYRSQFRLPYDLYLRLKQSADNNSRSLNAELILLLEEGLDLRDKLNPRFYVHDPNHKSKDPLVVDKNITDEEYMQEMIARVKKEISKELSAEFEEKIKLWVKTPSNKK